MQQKHGYEDTSSYDSITQPAGEIRRRPSLLSSHSMHTHVAVGFTRAECEAKLAIGYRAKRGFSVSNARKGAATRRGTYLRVPGQKRRRGFGAAQSQISAPHWSSPRAVGGECLPAQRRGGT